MRKICLTLLILSAASFVVAGYYFWRAQDLIDTYNRYLEMLNSIPGPHPPPSTEFERQMRFNVTVWQTTGFSLAFAGTGLGILTLLFYKKTRTATVMALILLSATFCSAPISPVRPTEETQTRWWVYHELQSPLDANAGLMDITPRSDFVFDKPGLTNPSYSFVAFWLNLERVDAVSKLLENIQAGYFINRTGRWLYAEVLTLYDYHLDTQAMPDYLLNRALELQSMKPTLQTTISQ